MPAAIGRRDYVERLRYWLLRALVATVRAGTIGAMATTVLGAAGESLGMSRMLKANTAKKRIHSLFRQGCHYDASIHAMKQEQREPQVQRVGEYLLNQPVHVRAFGLE